MCSNKEQIRQIRLKLNFTQEELAKKLQISKQYLSNVEKGIKKLQQDKFDELMRIYKDLGGSESEQNIEFDFLGDSFELDKDGKNLVSLTQSKNVGMSLGLFENCSKEDKYAAIRIASDSMEPTLKNGSTVVLKYCGYQDIIDNAMYAFYYDDSFYIRRLSKNLLELIVRADNKKYTEFVLGKKDIKKIKIVGMVVAATFS